MTPNFSLKTVYKEAFHYAKGRYRYFIIGYLILLVLMIALARYGMHSLIGNHQTVMQLYMAHWFEAPVATQLATSLLISLTSYFYITHRYDQEQMGWRLFFDYFCNFFLVGIILFYLSSLGMMAVGFPISHPAEHLKTLIMLRSLSLPALVFYIFISTSFFFAFAYVLFENHTPIKALKNSWKLVKQRWFKVLAIFVIQMLVFMVTYMLIRFGIITALAAGNLKQLLVPCLYLLLGLSLAIWLMPVMVLAYFRAYEQLRELQGAPVKHLV